MNGFGNDYTTMMEHKARLKEMIAQAENERTRRSLRQVIERRVRRIIRINNDPLR